MFSRIIKRLHLEKYVSSKLIFGLDLAISVGVSLFALFITSALFTSFAYDISLLLFWSVISLASSAVLFLFLQTHKNIIRHSTLRELWPFGLFTLGKGVVMFAIIKALKPEMFDNVYIWTALFLDILCSGSSLVAVRVMMVLAYDIVRERQKRHAKCLNVLVYGVGPKSVAQITRLPARMMPRTSNRALSHIARSMA